MKQDQEILTVKQAAELLQMSRPAVMTAYKSGQIPGVMINKRVRFIKKLLMEYLETKSNEKYNPHQSLIYKYCSVREQSK